MFCPNCSKLVMMATIRSCITCRSNINNNLSVLCEKCSNADMACSICLKKIYNQNLQPKSAGCRSCGK